jgi:hypothetical protein
MANQWVAGLLAGAAMLAYAQPKTVLNPEALVNDWLKRLNALADSTGDTSNAVDRFAELYDPAVLQFTGPNENQLGPVTYSGIEGIRKWADNFAKTYSKSEVRIQVHTEKVKTAGLLHVTEPPWGGLSVSVELTAFYTMRENNKGFMTPGAAFLEFSEAGKVRRARIYLEKDETLEITK